ncbi:hypothetical protein ACQ4PT_023731 [Festuca glaucescens]
MAVALTVTMAVSLIFLLLLPLAQATVSSAVIPANPKTIKFMAKDVRAFIKESAKYYMEQNAQQGGSGALVFDLSVGTSPQTLPVVMDITSELVWAQCVPCPTCTRLTAPGTPTFLPNNSDSVDRVHCASKTCGRMIPGDHGCDHDSDLCRYAEDFYGAANTSGFLITDTFSFGTTPVPDVVFGCSLDVMEPDLAGASGFAGFSRGALSLVSQLDISSFTYFIAPLDDPAGESFVSWSWGADDDLDIAGAQMSREGSTPLQAATENQNPDLYYVKLTGVMVDGQLLTSIPAGTFNVQADGSGGVFLSTTLPVTYLEVAGYRAIRRELVSRFRSEGMAPVNVASDLGHLCFLTEDFTSAKVPRLALVFDGDAAMELKVENYFLAVTGGQTCLTILPSRFGSVLGVLLQAGRNMTYDIQGGQLRFQTTTAMVVAGAPAPPERVSLMIMATLLVLLLGPRSLF